MGGHGGMLFDVPAERGVSGGLHRRLRGFEEFGARTREVSTLARGGRGEVLVPTYVNEFWTSRQRAAHRLHEISYRACFKPQLPAFFIELLTGRGDTVYDPFMGRGTTPIEAALRGRVPVGNDLNPLSRVLVEPRLRAPRQEEVVARLAEVRWEWEGPLDEDHLVFYHPETLREIHALRAWLIDREDGGVLDDVDRWIRMVAVNRLTGHSPGFFSVYTLPPNQATSAAAQRRINARRSQVPPRRSVPELIARKSDHLLKGVTARDREGLQEVADRAVLTTAPAAATPALADGSVDLVVTSPPFLDVVQYAGDNWLRCWFCGIEPDGVELTVVRDLASWQRAMTAAFEELHRVVRPGGHVAFEVGEVRGGTVQLEEAVIPCALRAGFTAELVLINEQQFTKTANCWGVSNNRHGTNTNRIVLLTR